MQPAIKHNAEHSRMGSVMKKLKGAFGWLPALAGLASWVLAGLYPRAQMHFFLLGLVTSIVVSVIAHELAHFIAARLLGLNPWWFNIGHGAILFEKQFRKVRLTLKEFPYSGLVFPLIIGNEQSRARWKVVVMVAAGPLSNAILFGTFWVNTPKINAIDFSNWDLISWEMCIANAYLLLVALVPFQATKKTVKLPNDGLHLILLLFGQWLGSWAENLRKGSWDLIVNQVKAETLLRLYRDQLNDPTLSQDKRVLVLDGFATCVLMYGAYEFLQEADCYSQELFEIKPAEWTVKGTRGSILVETGDIERGMAMLSQVMEHDPSAFDRAIAASFLALGELKRSNRESALKWLRISHDLDPDCASAHRVQSLLDSQDNISAPFAANPKGSQRAAGPS